MESWRDVNADPSSPWTRCAELGDATAPLSTFAVWSYTIIVALLAIIPVVLFVRNLRLAWRARATHEGQTVLKAGPAVIVGNVDHPYDPPLRVEITQTGTPATSDHGSGWYHWTETRRDVTANRFQLTLPDEASVEVLPDESVELLLDMERTERDGEKARRRIAEVKDGDTVHVSGRLAVTKEVDPTAGYRGGERERFVLRPAGRGGMLVSKRPLEDVFRQPLRHYRRSLVLLAVVTVVVHALFMGFHARSHGGQVHPAEVTAKRVVYTGDNNDQEHYVIDLRLPGGRELEADPTTACYQRLEEGDRVPVLVHPGYPSFWQIGPLPSVNLVAVFAGFGVLVAGFIAYALLLRASRSWYGGRLLDEEDEPPGADGEAG